MQKNNSRQMVKSTWLCTLALALSLTLFLSSYTDAWAQSTLPATQDTFVDPNNPTVNYDAGKPNGGRLEVAYSRLIEFAPTRRFLLQFDLSGTATNLSASPVVLYLGENNIPANATVTLSLYTTGDTWQETTVTHNTTPAPGTLLQSIAIAADTENTQLRFDAPAVSDYLEGERTGDGTASLLLRLDTDERSVAFGGNLLFEDREGSADGVNGNEPHIVIVPPTAAGDCNSDLAINAGDLSAVVLEIFDGDGAAAADVAGGAFPGAPGCDANQDTTINAGDITCVVLRIFNGPNACEQAVASPTTPSAQIAERESAETHTSQLFLPLVVSDE